MALAIPLLVESLLAIAFRLDAIAIGLEAIAIGLEAIAIGVGGLLEASAIRLRRPLLLGWR